MASYRSPSEGGPMIVRVSLLSVLRRYVAQTAAVLAIAAAVFVLAGLVVAAVTGRPLVHTVAVTLFCSGLALLLGGSLAIAPMWNAGARFRERGTTFSSIAATVVPVGIVLIGLAFAVDRLP